MAWPTIDQLKAEMGINQALSAELEANLARSLDAAIDQVLIDCYGAGGPPEVDPPVAFVPSHSQEAAALLLAVKVSKAPSAPFGVAAVFDAGGIYVAARDPQYRRLLKGQRQVFGVA